MLMVGVLLILSNGGHGLITDVSLIFILEAVSIFITIHIRMAAMSAMPQLEKEIIRKACSDPSFVAMIYLIIKLSANESLIPPPTIIGGAAFMLHAYVLNGRNKARMQEAIRAVPQTSDIDIAIWYTKVKDKDTFLSKNNTMVDKIRENLTKKEGQFTNILLEQLRRLLPDPSIIDTFAIQVTKEEPRDKRFEHMTTKININFIINGMSIPVVDIAIKNAIYSQYVRNGRNRSEIPVSENISHTSAQNTVLLKIIDRNNSRGTPDVYVRVPTLERLIEQQQFAISAMSGRADITKYQARIDYLRQHPELGSAAALDDVRARFARAVEDTNAMRASLPPPASLSRAASLPLHPGRSIYSLSKKGGKRRTHKKNKHHKKRRQTKRN